MKKVIWHGGRKCDICGKEIKEGRLYDARTTHDCWATMCNDCYVRYGVGVGNGKGQRYELNENGEFEKMKG